MKLRKVKINSIQVPEVRVTAQFHPEIWEQFRASIKETGAIAPIIVYETEQGLVLCDGLHRLVEAQKNGETHINAAVIPGDMIDVLTKNIFLDHLRGKTPVSQMVSVIETLSKEFNLDSEKIAAKTGMTRDYVERLQGISELTPFCRQALDEERIRVGHAVALTKVKDPIRQEMILGQQLLYNWTVKDLEEHIKNILEMVATTEAAAPPTEAAAPPTIKCFFCKTQHDISEIANPNICTECSGILLMSIAQARAELAQELSPKTE